VTIFLKYNVLLMIHLVHKTVFDTYHGRWGNLLVAETGSLRTKDVNGLEHYFSSK
jgi:hypothetical protein